jgi:hypothetical protein
VITACRGPFVGHFVLQKDYLFFPQAQKDGGGGERPKNRSYMSTNVVYLRFLAHWRAVFLNQQSLERIEVAKPLRPPPVASAKSANSTLTTLVEP